jgi:hypothetical protein
MQAKDPDHHVYGGAGPLLIHPVEIDVGQPGGHDPTWAIWVNGVCDYDMGKQKMVHQLSSRT